MPLEVSITEVLATIGDLEVGRRQLERRREELEAELAATRAELQRLRANGQPAEPLPGDDG